MSNSNIKVIAIIASIVLVFTLVTSNAVSIASVIFLAKGTTVSGTVGDTDNGGTTTDNGGASTNTNNNTATTAAPAGNNTATTAAPAGSDNTATTAAPAGNDNTATTAAPAGDNNTANNTQSKSKEEVLKIYTDLMNKAKADKVGYTKVEYQTLPDDAASRQISKGAGLVGTLLDLVDSLGIMTSKETAEADPEVVEKGGDMRWFPVYKQEKGCYITDPNALKDAKYEDLGNGKARVTIVLNDEKNPEPMADGSGVFVSNTGAVFSPLSKADIDNTLNGGAVKAVIKNVTYSLTYHDCTAIVEYDTATNQITKIEQYSNVTINANGKIFGVSEIQIDKQELVNTMVITNVQY